jgi:hypothetical protein
MVIQLTPPRHNRRVMMLFLVQDRHSGESRNPGFPVETGTAYRAKGRTGCRIASGMTESARLWTDSKWWSQLNNHNDQWSIKVFGLSLH